MLMARCRRLSSDSNSPKTVLSPKSVTEVYSISQLTVSSQKGRTDFFYIDLTFKEVK